MDYYWQRNIELCGGYILSVELISHYTKKFNLSEGKKRRWFGACAVAHTQPASCLGLRVQYKQQATCLLCIKESGQL